MKQKEKLTEINTCINISFLGYVLVALRFDTIYSKQ